MGGPKKKSGTPVETEALARRAGKTTADVFRSPEGGTASIEEVFARLNAINQGLAADSAMNFLGLSPEALSGLSGAVSSALAPIGSRLDPVANAAAVFNRRAQNELLGNLIERGGALGAGGSGNLANAAGLAGAELADRQALGLAELALNRQGQQEAFLSNLFPQLLASSQTGIEAGQNLFANLLNFGTPGAPVFQKSFGQKLLGGLGTLAGGILGSAAGPLGTAIGSKLGGIVTGAGGPDISSAGSGQVSQGIDLGQLDRGFQRLDFRP